MENLFSKKNFWIVFFFTDFDDFNYFINFQTSFDDFHFEFCIKLHVFEKIFTPLFSFLNFHYIMAYFCAKKFKKIGKNQSMEGIFLTKFRPYEEGSIKGGFNL
jgi:hypothetical protein